MALLCAERQYVGQHVEAVAHARRRAANGPEKNLSRRAVRRRPYSTRALSTAAIPGSAGRSARALKTVATGHGEKKPRVVWNNLQNKNFRADLTQVSESLVAPGADDFVKSHLSSAGIDDPLKASIKLFSACIHAIGINRIVTFVTDGRSIDRCRAPSFVTTVLDIHRVADHNLGTRFPTIPPNA
jgi:hypothetical protein